MTDKIADTLGLEPIPKSNNDVIHSISSDIVSSDVKQRDIDYEYSRNAIYDVIEAGKNSITDMMDIARQSGNAKDYEAISLLMDKTIKAAKQLSDLSKDSVDKSQSDSPSTVNNNLFVGSTSELQSLINKNIEK